MCSEEERKSGKDEAERDAPHGFPEFCEGNMPAGMEECCGVQMREMMSRCMARFRHGQKGPDKTEGTEV